jgi:3',5'-cyclic-AMP phosphodiesterase
MPITLPQLTRREFLRRAMLAGAAATLVPSAWAGLPTKPRDPHTFAFFSDTHIAANPQERYLGVNMSDHLAECIRQVAVWPVTPAAVMLNGDLAFLAGKRGDYATFGQVITPLRAVAPLHLSFGNHDHRGHFWAAFPADAAAQKKTLHRQAAVLPAERVNWLQLDSLDRTDDTPGKLRTAQLHWLTQELDARPDKPAIVLVHHNPQFNNHKTGLMDTPELMEVVAPRRHVKAIIYGHTHNWQITEHQPSGIHLINLPPTSYPFLYGRPAGWVRVSLAADSADFELRSLDSRYPDHGKVHTLKWRV